MRETSLRAWIDIQPQLGQKQLEVYKVIEKHQPISDKEIARILNWPINCCVGRRNELVEKYKVVEDAGIVICPITNRSVHIWRIK